MQVKACRLGRSEIGFEGQAQAQSRLGSWCAYLNNAFHNVALKTLSCKLRQPPRHVLLVGMDRTVLAKRHSNKAGTCTEAACRGLCKQEACYRELCSAFAVVLAGP